MLGSTTDPVGAAFISYQARPNLPPRPQQQFHVSSSDGSQRPLWLWAGGAEGRDRARQARQPPAFFNGHEREGHAGGRYIHCLIATSVSLKLAVAVLLRTASTDCWRMYV